MEGSHSGLVRAPAKRLLRVKSGSRVRIPLPPPEGPKVRSKIVDRPPDAGNVSTEHRPDPVVR
jgi:hypothetical protein